VRQQGDGVTGDHGWTEDRFEVDVLPGLDDGAFPGDARVHAADTWGVHDRNAEPLVDSSRGQGA
jgi:hypothetical protein